MICQHCGHDLQGRNACPQCKRVDIEALRSVQVSPSATPSRKNAIPPRRPNNSFEKGIRKDERGIPYLDKNGQPLRMGEGFDRSKYKRSERSTVHISSTGGN